MKPCPTRKAALTALASQSLDAAEVEELQAHLNSCAGCRNYLSELQTLCRNLGEPIAKVPAMDLPPRFHGELVRRVSREAQVEPGILTLLRVWLTPLRIGFAVGVAVLGFLILYEPAGESGKELTLNTNHPPEVLADVTPIDIAETSTLMAYQRAFVASFEDLEVLLSENDRRTPDDVGTTLLAASR